MKLFVKLIFLLLKKFLTAELIICTILINIFHKLFGFVFEVENSEVLIFHFLANKIHFKKKIFGSFQRLIRVNDEIAFRLNILFISVGEVHHNLGIICELI